MPADDIAEITTQAQIAAEVGTPVDLALDADTPWSDRRPYSQRTVYHTPPRFSSAIIQSIRHGAAKLFKVCLVRWDHQAVQDSILFFALCSRGGGSFSELHNIQQGCPANRMSSKPCCLACIQTFPGHRLLAVRHSVKQCYTLMHACPEAAHHAWLPAGNGPVRHSQV